MKKLPRFMIAMAVLAALVSLSGCGPKVRQYAQEARSSYISARAVLVGVQEFPSQMEELLRSNDLEAIKENAHELISDTRNLLSSAAMAFEDCKEKCQRLKGEGNKEFEPYADKLLELVGLNEQLISLYSEYIGLSNSLLENTSFSQNPAYLMPILNNLDSKAQHIQELRNQIALLEEETEQLYQELMK